MALSAGARLSHYEILAPIGAGGMGEVYRARDHRLGRDVAVKIVATDRPGDAGLLARLEQEARIAASLNHPNIIAIFDVGTHEGAPFIVSELLDGEPLRDRLASGPLPVRKAVEYGSQLADALAAAHVRGVIHRDLKPENVFVTREGRPKILDFGLAKASALEPVSAATALQTLPGIVMGTVGYMSPEQVAGRPADHRTDIFSLGVVLDEMVTGRRTFKGPTAAETMAAIARDDPSAASSVNPSVPAALDRIIHRCLEKSPGERFQSASDLSFALSTLTGSDGYAQDAPRTPAGRSRSLQTMAIAALAASIGAALAWYATRLAVEPPVTRVTHFTVDLRSLPVSESQLPLALSPDGTKLVVSLGSYQGAQLYLRALDRPDLQPIPGTLGGFDPFFSPDGKWIGFFSSMELKKAPISGGAVVPIYQTNNTLGASAAWGTNDTIYFTPHGRTGMSTGAGVLSVPSSGGKATAVTTLGSGEIAHQEPALLTGGRAILFTAFYGDVTGQAGASVQRSSRVTARFLNSGEQRTLIEGASFARYSPTGHILYVKDGTLLAAPFDIQRLALTGPPIVVSNDVAVNGDGTAQLALSSEGTLAYVERTRTDRRSVVWVDRRGETTPAGFGERPFETPRISPDGSRIAALIRDKTQADVWVQERTGALSRLTFEGGVEPGPMWTPTGNAITFSTLVDGKGAIVSQAIEGERASRVLYSAASGVWPGSWTRDGQTLAFMEMMKGGGDVNLLRAADSSVTPFVNSPATEWGARLSPDDQWMAYTSNESGHWEVYVRPYPGSGTRRQISNGGGAEIVWARSGRELFYRNGTKLMAVDIQTAPSFSAGNPRVLFDGPFTAGQPGLPGYDVSPDGQRFLMVTPAEAGAAQRPIHVILNWFTDLEQRVPTR